MSVTTIFALPSNIEQEPIREGDAALIIRRNGEIAPMTVGVDQTKVDVLREKDVHEMNEEELNMALQGQTLFLLTMAAKSEVIMDFLGKIATQQGGDDASKLRRAVQTH